MGPTVVRWSALATFAFAMAPVVVHAQTGAPTREELNPARRATPLAPAPDLFSNPEAGPCPLAENPAALTVTAVNLQGLESVPAEALAPAYAPFLNKAGGDASDLCKIRDAVADAMFERGILARVEIPAQTIDGGVATIEVIEAKIANVNVRGDPGPAGPVVERYAAKLRGMAPFDMRRVQRYILLASDIPGLRVRASVRPSTTGARGAVDLDLAVERDAEELTVNAQNLQSKFTGRWGLLGRYDLNAHGKAGQRTSMVLYRTIRNEQWVAQGTHERRLGSEGAVVRASVAYGESRPGAGLKALGLKSTNVVVNVEGAYPLLRTRRENLWVSAGIEVVEQDTKIGPAKLINDDLRQLFLKLEGDQTVYYGYRPIVLRGQAGARQGFEGFGSSRAGDRTLSRADAKPDAWTLFAEGSVDVLVTPQWTVHAEVAGQYADKPLAAYAEYASGALTIGRGYDPGYVTGDKALAASLEVRGGPFQPWAGATFSPYAFFDVAHVSDNDRGGANQTLKSVGFGVQTPLRDNWVLDVGYARPLDKRAIARRKPTDRLTFNLTTRFF